jgi:BlaI family transcriptional regulator, penicillinase repressor
MKKPAHISEAEAGVMDAIWQLDGSFTAAELIEKLSVTKEWKQTTIFTFLSRLCGKGLLKNEKSGKVNVYEPLLSKTEYKSFVARDFLDGMHGGSIRNFVATLYENNDLSPEEIEDLKKWFDKR